MQRRFRRIVKAERALGQCLAETSKGTGTTIKYAEALNEARQLIGTLRCYMAARRPGSSGRRLSGLYGRAVVGILLILLVLRLTPRKRSKGGPEDRSSRESAIANGKHFHKTEGVTMPRSHGVVPSEALWINHLPRPLDDSSLRDRVSTPFRCLKPNWLGTKSHSSASSSACEAVVEKTGYECFGFLRMPEWHRRAQLRLYM
jgi:hypothetical protein